MRILLLLRGIPASGKSTWIAQCGLEAYTLSPDSLRLMASAPILLPYTQNTHISSQCLETHTHESNTIKDTLYAINQKNDKAIWKILFSLLEMRMERGDFTIIDATHTSTQGLRAYESLANTYRYRIFVADFDIDFTTATKRNATRGFKAVPQSILESMYTRYLDSKHVSLPSRYKVYDANELAPQTHSSARNLKSPLAFTPIDLNAYEAIHHIGDIHGCFETLLEYLLYFHHKSPYISLENALKTLQECAFEPQICAQFLNPKAYYIFLGDYIDRGISNALVLRFLLGIMDLPNVCLLEGNHERWLYKWGREELSNNEFSTFTLRDLEQDLLTPKDTHKIYSKLRQCAYYTFDEKLILATHGGLSTLPDNLLFIATHQLIYGSGDYEDMQATAQSFAHSTAPNTYQVFGHRNREKHPICVHNKSFALEGGVEFGGALRALIVHKIHTTNNVNTHKAFFHSMLPLYFTPAKLNSSAPIMGTINMQEGFTQIYMQNKHNLPSLMNRHNTRKLFSLLQKLRASSLIKERTFGHISSFNFTKQAFFDKRWNNLTCKARGLFIDTKDYKILARSYDKFFNYQENEQYADEALCATLCYPIDVYVKENGFLGIMSVYEDNFFITSKSDPTSSYASIARELIIQSLEAHALSLNISPQDLQMQLRKYLQTQNLSLVFEIIDPINDPHIISYKEPCVVLLDAIFNTQDYVKIPYDALCALGREFGFTTKHHLTQLRSWEEFQDFIKAQDKEDSVWNLGAREDGYIEGYVLEDSAGFMLKLKGTYYRTWKILRGIIEHYEKTHTLPKAKMHKFTDSKELISLEKAFLNYLSQHPIMEQVSLIDLRTAFLKTHSSQIISSYA